MSRPYYRVALHPKARRQRDKALRKMSIYYGEWYDTGEIEVRDGIKCHVWKRDANRPESEENWIGEANYSEVKWIPVARNNLKQPGE